MTRSTAHLSLLVAAVLVALISVGCGSGGDSDASKVVTLPNGQEISVSEMIDTLAQREPKLISQLCLVVDAGGRDLAFASFEQGFNLAVPEGALPAKEVFNEVVKRC